MGDGRNATEKVVSICKDTAEDTKSRPRRTSGARKAMLRITRGEVEGESSTKSRSQEHCEKEEKKWMETEWTEVEKSTRPRGKPTAG